MLEDRQGYFKGGADHPLSDEDLAHKFRANVRHGGLGADCAERLLQQLPSLLRDGSPDWSLLALENLT